MAESAVRYVALDLHRHYALVAAVDADKEVVLEPRRVRMGDLEDWAAKHLRSTDKVAIEASTNVWATHDILAPLVAEVVVVHPTQFKIIASSSVKTDKRDTLALARVLAAGLLTSVWVPPDHVRELRSLINHRATLISERRDARNRLHGVLQIHNIAQPPGEIFVPAKREWWFSLELPASIQMRVRHDWELIDVLNRQVEEAEEALTRLSVSEEWVEQVPFLVQLPGIAVPSAMTILSAVGDIRRFETADKLVGYAGLGAKVHSSGQQHHTGRISKAGRAELRTTAVESAWIAVQYHPFWKEEYGRLARRIGNQKAIVAIARKLLIAVWNVLTKQAADRHADPQMVARSFYYWGGRHRLATSIGKSRQAFVDYFMEKVQLEPIHLTM